MPFKFNSKYDLKENIKEMILEAINEQFDEEHNDDDETFDKINRIVESKEVDRLFNEVLDDIENIIELRFK